MLHPEPCAASLGLHSSTRGGHALTGSAPLAGTPAARLGEIAFCAVAQTLQASMATCAGLLLLLCCCLCRACYCCCRLLLLLAAALRAPQCQPASTRLVAGHRLRHAAHELDQGACSCCRSGGWQVGHGWAAGVLHMCP